MHAAVLRYRVMAYITGVLIIVVCFVGIPMQIAAHNAFIVNDIGTIHGFLYIVYIIFAYILAQKLKLPTKHTVILLLAGTVPVMTFFVERWMMRTYIRPALAADDARVAELRAAHPGLVDAVRKGRPSLIVWAAAQGQPGSVELLAGLGFDVNAKGRSDAPAKDPWETALHVAAMAGNLDLARTLLSLGADPGIRDQRFDSTPLGWARHFGQEQLVELLAPITTEPEPAGD